MNASVGAAMYEAIIGSVTGVRWEDLAAIKMRNWAGYAAEALKGLQLDSTRGLVEDVITAHLPVFVQTQGQVAAAGCTCRQQPLDHTEHLARAIVDALSDLAASRSGGPAT